MGATAMNETRQFDFVSALTGVVVLVFLGASVYALAAGMITFEVFAAAVGSPASALIGFWVGGKR